MSRKKSNSQISPIGPISPIRPICYNDFMRNFLYAIVLVSLVVIGGYFSSKSNASGSYQSRVVSYPYQIIEIKPSGEQNQTDGVSQDFEPAKIIPDLGIAFYPEDRINVLPDPKMGIGSVITIHRAPAIRVIDGKKEAVYRSWTKTVGELLSEKNIELGIDDKISAPKEAEVFDGSKITITRVAKTIIIEPKPIDFNVVTKKNTSQEKDYKKIIQVGKPGVKNYYYLVTREDGVEVSRVLQKTEIASPPTDQIVEVGTIVKIYGTGIATWYNRSKMRVAASDKIPKGTVVNVVNTANGKNVVVTVDDHGVAGGAIIDLSRDAFEAIGSLSAGIINVRVEKYYPE